MYCAALDRRHERLRAMRVEGCLGVAAVRGQVAAAVGEQPLERGHRGLHGLGPDLGFRHSPLHRPAAPVRLPGLPLPALGSLPPLLLAGLGCRLPLLLPLLLGGQPLRLRRRLLPGALGLLLVPEPGLGGAFLLPAQLSGLLLRLSRDSAFFRGPRPGGLFFQLLLLQLGFLAGLIHLGEQRLSSGHHVLRAGQQHITAATDRNTVPT